MSMRAGPPKQTDAGGRAFEAAQRRGFPAFLTPVELSTPVNATPYLARYDKFLARAGRWPGRRPLVEGMEEVRCEAGECGVTVEAVLIGGSFADLSNRAPGDGDCLMFYRRTKPDRPVEAGRLADLQRRGKARGVDARFVPIDADPLALINAVSYFTSLYSQEKPGRRSADPNRIPGLLLLDCRE